MSLGAASIGSPRSKSVEIVEEAKKWSGLSESNRHLNLGKVPYYHYTKAAYLRICL